MLVLIGILALILVISALLAWSLHSFVPYAAGALGIIILNIPGAHWIVQYTALGLTFVCFMVSCVNQHNVPEGSTKTDDQKRSERRADRYAIFAILAAVFYTGGTWLWRLLDYLRVDEFFAWLWSRNLRLPVIGGLLIAYVIWRLVRRQIRRRANQSTTTASPAPAPAANLSSVS
jgi:hypothetical protein